MTNTKELIDYIRFQLDQLSTQNAHHAFELLCFHIARIKIDPFLLPSTGPVSSGGDQGRDFESFRTNLTAALNTDELVGLFRKKQKFGAGACSLQIDYEAKIKDDVAKIMGSGTPVQIIYFFSPHDIPVGKRHEMQALVKKSHMVGLEIFDGQAISTNLADPDAFWIAHQYLAIPSEMYPEPIKKDEWYKELHIIWAAKDPDPHNYADFMEVKRGIRHAEYTKEYIQDIGFWLKKMDFFINKTSSPAIRRWAIYENAFGCMKGQRPCIGQESLIREYFSHIPHIWEVRDFEDAGAMINLVIGETRRENLDIKPEEIQKWISDLNGSVEKEIQIAKTKGRQCELSAVRAFNCLFGDPAQKTPDERKFKQWLITATNCLFSWLKSTFEEIESAPLFPVEMILDRLTKFSNVFDIIADHPDFNPIIGRFEEILGKRRGDSAVAERSRDRAFQLYNRGLILRAISELHRTRVNWGSAETLRGAMLSMIFIAQWYNELKLDYAAKYYTLAAAYLAQHARDVELKQYLPPTLFLAAECDFRSGDWINMMEILEITIPSYFVLSPNTASDDDKAMGRAIIFLSFIQYFSERFLPEFLPNIPSLSQKFQNNKLYDQAVDRHRKDFTELTDFQAWRKIQRMIHSRPFGDAGIQRNVRWKELGMELNISWKNSYEFAAIGEQYACLLQILLTHLTGIDLCFLPTSITLQIEHSNDSTYHAISTPSNEGRIWRIQVPHSKSFTTVPKNYLPSLLTTVFYVLFENSLLPSPQFTKIWDKYVKEAFRLGVFLGNSYEEIYTYFIPQKMFNEELRKKTVVPLLNMKFRFWPPHELGWFASQGLTYSKEGAQIALQMRYANANRVIKYTLPKLLKSKEIWQSIQCLKDDGWLDWQILLSLAMITINYRLNKEGIDLYKDRDLFRMRMFQEFEKDESETAINVPLGEYSRKKILDLAHLNMIASVGALELEIHQRTPDFPAIKRFLRERYNYFTDDLPHNDPFRLELIKVPNKESKKGRKKSPKK